VYITWSENPEDWAPTNHSCQPNMYYKGLNNYALRDIEINEPLTIDYGTFIDEEAS
jgi:SET domain-containing protein